MTDFLTRVAERTLADTATSRLTIAPRLPGPFGPGTDRVDSDGHGDASVAPASAPQVGREAIVVPRSARAHEPAAPLPSPESHAPQVTASRDDRRSSPAAPDAGTPHASPRDAARVAPIDSAAAVDSPEAAPADPRPFTALEPLVPRSSNTPPREPAPTAIVAPAVERAPMVTITIGRIEVRATPASAPTPARPARREEPGLSLRDYLRRGRGGAR